MQERRPAALQLRQPAAYHVKAPAPPGTPLWPRPRTELATPLAGTGRVRRRAPGDGAGPEAGPGAGPWKALGRGQGLGPREET